MKTVGVVGAGALVPNDLLAETTLHASAAIAAETVTRAPGEISDLTSTSGIFTPPRGRSCTKFSFDFKNTVGSFSI